MANYAAFILIILFAFCELAFFFYNHSMNDKIISNYEVGYTYDLQDFNLATADIIKGYKSDTLFQSGLSIISFTVEIIAISLIFGIKNNKKPRLKYILCIIVILVYFCVVIIPMSFTTIKKCTYSVMPKCIMRPEPVFQVDQNGERRVLRVNYVLQTSYEGNINISENREFNGAKMCLMSGEIIIAAAAIFVLNKFSNQDSTTSTNDDSEDDHGITKT